MTSPWEEQADAWARFARSPRHDHFFWDWHAERFLELVPPAGTRTLDLGCGEGRLGRLLRRRGHRVLAVDRSLPLARLAAAAGGQVLVAGDAAHLPLRTGCADLGVAFMSLQDMGALAPTLTELARVLAPGSALCLAIAHPLRSAGSFDTKAADSAFRVRDYFGERVWPWTHRHTGVALSLPGFHRPLEAYAGGLERAGFVIEALREPRPDDAETHDYAESQRWRRLPCFLHLRARRGGA